MTSRLPLYLLAAAALAVSPLAAQSVDDVLRYSETNTTGTARSMATGNSMGAIGAEWTAAQSNPAGLAAFRQNEATATLGVLVPGTSDSRFTTNVDPTTRRQTNSGSEVNVALPQVALVFTREPIASRWTQLNFGLGVSQTNRFEENVVYGDRLPGSITDNYLESTNNFYEGDPFAVGEFFLGESLSFRSNAIREFSDSDPFVTDNALYTSDYDQQRLLDEEQGLGFDGPLLDKSGNVSRNGYASSFDLSLAGNYDEKLMIGLTAGLVVSNFEDIDVYEERDEGNVVARFESLAFRQNRQVEGSGLYARIGAIYRASQAFRVGLAYHSPTLNRLTDTYTANFEYTYTEGGEAFRGQANVNEPDIVEYRIKTPSQLRASVGSVLGRRAFVGAEVAYVNYPGARLRYTSEGDFGDAEEGLAAVIEDRFQSAINGRIGAELNFAPLQVRAGVEYFGAPIVEEDASYAVSAGVGYRFGRLSIDAAYRLNVRPDRVYQPYRLQTDFFPEPRVDYTPTLGTGALTLGWKLGPRLED